MARYFCHEYPDVLGLETKVLDARPGAVALERTPFHPGGGGQLADRGVLRFAGGETRVMGCEVSGDRVWHLLADSIEVAGTVEIRVDSAFRAMMTQLHTETHILNALVYRAFDGALVTGAQLNDDGTARMDFDLPDADNDRLRALEPAINDVIRQDLPLRYEWLDANAAAKVPGLLRSRSVAPPPAADGTVRIVEIVGLDRQACGGTHLATTALSPPIRILRIDNKGRHNRCVRLGLVSSAGQ
jgi:misacylated tRNA(Ala) deacylase